jgi:hypothetical protein
MKIESPRHQTHKQTSKQVAVRLKQFETGGANSDKTRENSSNTLEWASKAHEIINCRSNSKINEKKMGKIKVKKSSTNPV